jgi:hypothetical protein
LLEVVGGKEGEEEEDNSLCNVDEHVNVVLVSAHVLVLNQPFDLLLIKRK